MFKRKVYDKLKEWKDTYNGKYACLLEGARRVGKTTIAEEFAENEYQTYIKIDFSNITDELLDVFKDINKLDLFFLRLQTETGIDLFKRKSVIIFDEIQLYPKARQAIKHLVADGRYDYSSSGAVAEKKTAGCKPLRNGGNHKWQRILWKSAILRKMRLRRWSSCRVRWTVFAT